MTEVSPGMTVKCLAKGKEKTVEAEAVLMAVGRRPVIPDGLVELGVKLNRGAVVVNDSMEVEWESGNDPEGGTIYAIGDVNGRCMLAHAASAQGEILQS